MLDEDTVNALIVLPCVAGLVISAYQWVAVSRVNIDGHPELLAKQDSKSATQNQEIVAEMIKIASTIQKGAMSFLIAEYTYMAAYIVVFGAFLAVFTGVPTTVAFVVGSVTSILCGWIGMSIAVYTNVRTTHQCWKDLKSGFDVAIQGGCVMGLSLVSLGILGLFVLVVLFKQYFAFETEQEMYEAIAGYGLGGSSIALFGRVGG